MITDTQKAVQAILHTLASLTTWTGGAVINICDNIIIIFFIAQPSSKAGVTETSESVNTINAYAISTAIDPSTIVNIESHITVRASESRDTLHAIRWLAVTGAKSSNREIHSDKVEYSCVVMSLWR